MGNRECRNNDLIGINVIELSIQPTLGIMFTGHNICGAWLLTPLGVGIIVIKVTKVTMETKWPYDLYNDEVSVVVLL